MPNKGRKQRFAGYSEELLHRAYALLYKDTQRITIDGGLIFLVGPRMEHPNEATAYDVRQRLDFLSKGELLTLLAKIRMGI